MQGHHSKGARGVSLPHLPHPCEKARFSPITRKFEGRTVFVAATGPSLTHDVAANLRGHSVVAVSDAYLLLPFADMLYACDSAWWIARDGALGFEGERWSTHEKGSSNDKQHLPATFNVRLAPGKAGDRFRTDGVIAYGGNSGFQAANLAILAGAARLVLVGFDMRVVAGKVHFFGDHKRPLRNGCCFRTWIDRFTTASKHLPPAVQVLNATPESALKCFPFINLDDILTEGV
jgi:hypothetical protein